MCGCGCNALDSFSLSDVVTHHEQWRRQTIYAGSNGLNPAFARLFGGSRGVLFDQMAYFTLRSTGSSSTKMLKKRFFRAKEGRHGRCLNLIGFDGLRWRNLWIEGRGRPDLGERQGPRIETRKRC